MRRLPDVFIVGAPKSGTTSLFEALGRHPSVFTPIIKEPHFFLDDLPDQKTIKEQNEYDKLFHNALPSEVIVEGSIWYYRSPSAIRSIVSWNPSAKFIFCVREPSRMVVSLHAQLLHSLVESENSFEKAWVRGQLKDKSEGEVDSLDLTNYQHAANYSKAYSMLNELIDPSNVHVVVFERLINNSQTEIEKVCNFIGVEGGKNIKLNNANPRTRIRFKFIKKLLMRQDNISKHLKIFLKKFIGEEMYWKFVKSIVRINSIIEPSQSQRTEMMVKVNEFYAKSTKDFCEQLNDDLPEWFDGQTKN